MFETRNGDKVRTAGVRLFDQIPSLARAYMYILILFIGALLVMGGIDAFAPKPVFTAVIDRLLSFLGLVVGSVIGALSAAMKREGQATATP